MMCDHYDCRCARAAELAAMGRTLEAVEVHNREVPCRRFRKKNALDPAEREKPCDHALGFRYAGKIPCTGPKLCPMCGANEEDVNPSTGARV